MGRSNTQEMSSLWGRLSSNQLCWWNKNYTCRGIKQPNIPLHQSSLFIYAYIRKLHRGCFFINIVIISLSLGLLFIFIPWVEDTTVFTFFLGGPILLAAVWKSKQVGVQLLLYELNTLTLWLSTAWQVGASSCRVEDDNWKQKCYLGLVGTDRS